MFHIPKRNSADFVSSFILHMNINLSCGTNIELHLIFFKQQLDSNMRLIVQSLT